ncbi:uncharacterized protein LOC120351851 isoform X1 [Nilaparvata lugens]|uniref:uncharacterized protein LOC120351851 isoform X1 n=1 Tax=Nilaparvata lugens TaxID=108931 RepID=UPI00193E3067|nr:uncharacterized protein LOC120351851 isoform X1 [Nilaparvata lugens]
MIRMKEYKKCIDDSLQLLLTMKHNHILPPRSYFIIYEIISACFPLCFGVEKAARSLYFLMWVFIDSTLMFHCIPVIFLCRISELSFRDINLTINTFNSRNMNVDAMKRVSKRYMKLCNHMKSISRHCGPILCICQITMMATIILKHDFIFNLNTIDTYGLVNCLSESFRGIYAFYLIGEANESAYKEAKKATNVLRRVVSDHSEVLSNEMMNTINTFMITVNVFDVRIAPFGCYTIKRENVKSAVSYCLAYIMFVVQVHTFLIK